MHEKEEGAWLRASEDRPTLLSQKHPGGHFASPGPLDLAANRLAHSLCQWELLYSVQKCSVLRPLWEGCYYSDCYFYSPGSAPAPTCQVHSGLGRLPLSSLPPAQEALPQIYVSHSAPPSGLCQVPPSQRGCPPMFSAVLCFLPVLLIPGLLCLSLALCR